MKTEFSTFDIGKALKIPKERLREWIGRGFIHASVPAVGAGTKAIFTKADVYGVALFLRLVERGYNRSTSANFIKNFMERAKGKIEQTAYIAFRNSESKEKGVIGHEDILVLGENLPWRFEFTYGCIYLPKKVAEAEPHLTHPDPRMFDLLGERSSKLPDWESAYIVNFKLLRKKVDEALENL